MRTIILTVMAFLLSLFVGMAGVVTATNPVPSYGQFGPYGGFKNAGTVEPSYLTVDNDAFVGGDLAVTGDITAATGTIGGIALSSGTMAYDFSITANHYFLQSGTGTFGTGTGAVSLNGDTTVASGKNFAMTGAGTFGTGTGAVSMNGATTFAANKGIAMTSGTGAMDFSGGSGVFKTTTGVVTIGPGATSISGTVAYSINTSTMTADKTLTSANTKTVYEMDASGGDVTLTLPDATTVTGREYMIASNGNSGSYYIRVKSTAGKFGGANGIAASTGLKNTDDAGAGITIVSDGTNYLIVGAFGTWASG